jgi:flagellar L-ring protein precursor FlgH
MELRMMMRAPCPVRLCALAACGKLDQVGRAPDFSPLEGSYQHHALYSSAMPEDAGPDAPTDPLVALDGGTDSLFGDRRAAQRGDILTVVIEIDDKAEISNSTGRSRQRGAKHGPARRCSASPSGSMKALPEGASMADAVETSSDSTFKGSGNVSRKEKLTLRVAATVVEELPNGVLRIEGQQEVRVNFELRELIVTGYVRPPTSRGRTRSPMTRSPGRASPMAGADRSPMCSSRRYGQQVADIVLPF